MFLTFFVLLSVSTVNAASNDNRELSLKEFMTISLSRPAEDKDEILRESILGLAASLLTSNERSSRIEDIIHRADILVKRVVSSFESLKSARAIDNAQAALTHNRIMIRALDDMDKLTSENNAFVKVYKLELSALFRSLFEVVLMRNHTTSEILKQKLQTLRPFIDHLKEIAQEVKLGRDQSKTLPVDSFQRLNQQVYNITFEYRGLQRYYALHQAITTPIQEIVRFCKKDQPLLEAFDKEEKVSAKKTNKKKGK